MIKGSHHQPKGGVGLLLQRIIERALRTRSRGYVMDGPASRGMRGGRVEVPDKSWTGPPTFCLPARKCPQVPAGRERPPGAEKECPLLTSR